MRFTFLTVSEQQRLKDTVMLRHVQSKTIPIQISKFRKTKQSKPTKQRKPTTNKQKQNKTKPSQTKPPKVDKLILPL